MNKFVLISVLLVILIVIAILVYESGNTPSSYSISKTLNASQIVKNSLLIKKGVLIGGGVQSASFNLSKSSNTILADNFTYADIINFSQNQGTMWKIYDIVSSLPVVRLPSGISTYQATENAQLIGAFNNSAITINGEGHLIALEFYGKNDTIIFENGVLFYPSSMPGITVELGNNTYLIK